MKIIHNNPCIDHMGNIFTSIKLMCRFWNIRPETYTRRINVYKMTQEEALTKPVKSNGGLKCYDHLGKKYYSITSMCNHWNIDRKLYEYRISHGWSLERSLTTPPRRQNKKSVGKSLDRPE